MLTEVSRRAHKLLRELQRQDQTPIVGVEIEFANVAIADLFRPGPHPRRERLDHVLRQTQRLAHIPDGALGAISSHGRAERRLVMPIGFVDPLDDFFAPGMFKIDIDVRWLIALAADEALEQQVIGFRVDRGDAENIADRGIGGRAAPLAENTLRAGIADDGKHREKIGRILHRLYQIEFVPDDLQRLRR